MKRMFKDVELSATQQDLAAAIAEFHKDKKEQRRASMKDKHEYMADFVAGRQSKRSLLQRHASQQVSIKRDKKEGASLWMDLLESLDENQKDILFDNMQDLKQEHEERKKEHNRKRRGRGE